MLEAVGVIEDTYSLVRLLVHLVVAGITNTDFLCDAKMRQWHRLGGTLLIEHLAAVATVMFTIGECERVSTTQANIRVDPLWRSLGVHHG